MTVVSSVYLTELSRLSAFHLDSFRQLVSKCDCYFTLFCAVRYCTVFGQEPDALVHVYFWMKLKKKKVMQYSIQYQYNMNTIHNNRHRTFSTALSGRHVSLYRTAPHRSIVSYRDVWYMLHSSFSSVHTWEGERRAGVTQNTNITTWPSILYRPALFCSVLYCTVLYCTVLYYTVLLCTVTYCLIMFCRVLCSLFFILWDPLSPLPWKLRWNQFPLLLLLLRLLPPHLQHRM